MAFVKLDTGILDSTLWVERIQREVFITSLLLAEPRELTESEPQLEVRSLEKTGFLVPPGWYGFVPAAGVGIVRRAIVGQKEGMDALEALGAEDPESRSSEFGGRRLVRVSGGYIVLNFFKYRDKDHTAAERMRRLRERRKVTRNVTQQLRNVTQADSREQITEAYVEPPISPEMVAQAVRQELSISGRDLAVVLDEVCRARILAGDKPEALRDALIDSHKRWIAADIKFRPNLRAFFGEGIWMRPNTWQLNGGNDGAFKGKTESSLGAAQRAIQAIEDRQPSGRAGDQETGEAGHRGLLGHGG